MKAAAWLEVLAVILLLFAIGHTLGTAAPHVRRGPQEAAVYGAMQQFRFPIMGFTRSHWDFYRGFAQTVSLLLLALAALAWQLSGLSRRAPREALPMAITLLFCCTGLLILGWQFFFGVPIVMSAVAVVCATMVVVALRREAPAGWDQIES